MMVVHTLDRSGHSGDIGLHIGSSNAHQYFPKDMAAIELELDHLLILCSLEPSFWLERPEIHDLRLSSWLQSKRMSGKLDAQDGSVAMIPNGDRSFRLQLTVSGEISDPQPSGPSPAFVSEIGSPQQLHDRMLDRRKRDTGHTPERRKAPRDDAKRDYAKVDKLAAHASS